MDDERTPLLRRSTSNPPLLPKDLSSSDPHAQFCTLAGIQPSNLPKGVPWPKPSRTSIYQRAKRKESSQNRTYIFTAALTNTLLLSQIVIGAVLTALGASGISGIYVAIFGALNTVIAGLVTYLKSRGQPMRARMFRDDLERVVDQIENSETMWLGISSGMHGYDEIDIDDEVSVRSEVARLTRLYDKAVRNNTFNNPDMYLNGFPGASDATSGLRARPAPAPVSAPADAAAAPAPVPVASAVAPDPDEAPATKPKAPEPAAAPAPASTPTPAPTSAPEAAKDDKPAEAPTSNGVATAPTSDKPADAAAPPDSLASATPAAPHSSTPTSPTAPAATSANQTTVPLAADIDEGPVTGDRDDDRRSKTKKDDST